MNFRYDINGLRAIAVLAVVIFHFNPQWLPGGFAGVDVFFVISGFLMTSIIFSGVEKNTFNVFKFYNARANRIIPVLAAMSAVLLVFGWFYLLPTDYRDLGRQIEKSSLFISNLLFAKGGGYFDTAEHTKWLLHTWSLSVEWQFYIFFPIIIIALKKFLSFRNLKLVVLGLFLASFIYCIYATYKDSKTAYFLLTSRAWEMLLGGLAFLYPWSLKNKSHQIITQCLGIVLIIASYFLMSKDTPWPGYMALIPVLGAYLIVVANYQNNFLINNPISNSIGKWSYSIYVWHWPLVVLGFYFAFESWWIYGIPLSILLGFLSYQFIEKINFSRYSSWKEIYKVKPFYIFLIILACGYAVKETDGIDLLNYGRLSQVSEKNTYLKTYKDKHQNLYDIYWLKCNTYSSLTDKNIYDIDPICIQKNGDGGVFLWGDSHAEALSYGLRAFLKTNNIPFYQKTSAGCRALLTDSLRLEGNMRKACDHSNKIAIQSILKLKPRLVVIAQSTDHDKTDWDIISQKLLSNGVSEVILIGPVSQWQPSLPETMIKNQHWKTKDEYISDKNLDMTVIQIDQTMKKSKFMEHVHYISLIDHLCKFNNQKYYCRVKPNDTNDLIQVDYGHLSKEGSLFVVNNIIADKISHLYKDN
ncbi:acyltransferase family protein [Acinetobacter faecalis]|uniref:acyltransferase family protein n=1 Tax=Acinetobacter faecalis TaxID=2665161 RepID=UPI002A91A6C3|nr:acyltransferase family protein [Acinetobacter faecalis]MDY6450725.1 acyltransferase family protein [Acinetobacter faecalis]